MGFLVLAIPLELDGIHGVPAVGMCSVVFKSSGLGGCQKPILFFFGGGCCKAPVEGLEKVVGDSFQRALCRALPKIRGPRAEAAQSTPGAGAEAAGLRREWGGNRRDSSLGNV